jgi:hypothetical protein
MNPYVTAAEYFANPPEKLAKWQSLLCSRQVSVAGNWSPDDQAGRQSIIPTMNSYNGNEEGMEKDR